MKTGIHPTYYEDAQVVCICGNKYTVGSTEKIIHVELCKLCHPFYTGEQRFVDSASRIQKFQKKQEVASTFKEKKKTEERKRNSDAPKSLREMLMGLK